MCNVPRPMLRGSTRQIPANCYDRLCDRSPRRQAADLVKPFKVGDKIGRAFGFAGVHNEAVRDIVKRHHCSFFSLPRPGTRKSAQRLAHQGAKRRRNPGMLFDRR